MPPVHAVLLVVLLWAAAGCRAQTSEEDLKRPYSFGFTIENMQHRQEMKDSNGIITGEFGFVTADGWYTTTYYATDAEGKFKILGRKRERVGPPINPYQPVTTTTTPRPTTTVAPRPYPTQRPVSGITGCAGCIIPTTTAYPSAGSVGPSQGFQPAVSTAGYPSSVIPPLYPGSTPRPTIITSSTASSSSSQQNNFNSNTFTSTTTGQQLGAGVGAGVRPGVGAGVGAGAPIQPVQNGPLYRYNYTVGYHGHHETGFRDGSKKGDYFYDTRDGIRHEVTYEADEKGYRPTITQVKLPAHKIPTLETEKQAGLVGSEFVWFYKR